MGFGKTADFFIKPNVSIVSELNLNRPGNRGGWLGSLIMLPRETGLQTTGGSLPQLLPAGYSSVIPSGDRD